GVVGETGEGFVVAEEDLKFRGAGEWLGTRRTGDLAFRMADLGRDEALMAPAREVAAALLKQYPDRVERLLRRWLRGGEHFADV
ncbi:MAG: ATP-dependent DNA helicase RecG, partial [Alcanivorax sp.]|nr:ATP-dependent DNA helicase RecG [Alcanivorax sp.]